MTLAQLKTYDASGESCICITNGAPIELLEHSGSYSIIDIKFLRIFF